MEGKYSIELFRDGGEGAGIEKILVRHDSLTVARTLYKVAALNCSERLIMLCDRARVLARSDRPETMPEIRKRAQYRPGRREAAGGHLSMRLAFFELSQNHLLNRDQVSSVGSTEERPRLHYSLLGANQAVMNARKVILGSEDSLACFRDGISPQHKRRHGTNGIVSDCDAS
jgi:hypothetical protein